MISFIVYSLKKHLFKLVSLYKMFYERPIEVLGMLASSYLLTFSFTEITVNEIVIFALIVIPWLCIFTSHVIKITNLKTLLMVCTSILMFIITHSGFVILLKMGIEGITIETILSFLIFSPTLLYKILSFQHIDATKKTFTLQMFFIVDILIICCVETVVLYLNTNTFYGTVIFFWLWWIYVKSNHHYLLKMRNAIIEAYMSPIGIWLDSLEILPIVSTLIILFAIRYTVLLLIIIWSLSVWLYSFANIEMLWCVLWIATILLLIWLWFNKNKSWCKRKIGFALLTISIMFIIFELTLIFWDTNYILIDTWVPTITEISTNLNIEKSGRMVFFSPLEDLEHLLWSQSKLNEQCKELETFLNGNVDTDNDNLWDDMFLAYTYVLQSRNSIKNQITIAIQILEKYNWHTIKEISQVEPIQVANWSPYRVSSWINQNRPQLWSPAHYWIWKFHGIDVSGANIESMHPLQTRLTGRDFVNQATFSPELQKLRMLGLEPIQEQFRCQYDTAVEPTNFNLTNFLNNRRPIPRTPPLFLKPNIYCQHQNHIPYILPNKPTVSDPVVRTWIPFRSARPWHPIVPLDTHITIRLDNDIVTTRVIRHPTTAIVAPVYLQPSNPAVHTLPSASECARLLKDIENNCGPDSTPESDALREAAQRDSNRVWDVIDRHLKSETWENLTKKYNEYKRTLVDTAHYWIKNPKILIPLVVLIVNAPGIVVGTARVAKGAQHSNVREELNRQFLEKQQKLEKRQKEWNKVYDDAINSIETRPPRDTAAMASANPPSTNGRSMSSAVELYNTIPTSQLSTFWIVFIIIIAISGVCGFLILKRIHNNKIKVSIIIGISLWVIYIINSQFILLALTLENIEIIKYNYLGILDDFRIQLQSFQTREHYFFYDKIEFYINSHRIAVTDLINYISEVSSGSSKFSDTKWARLIQEFQETGKQLTSVCKILGKHKFFAGEEYQQLFYKYNFYFLSLQDFWENKYVSYYVKNRSSYSFF